VGDGTQTEDSDIDILIISTEINPKRHRRGKEIAGIKEWISLGLPVDITLLTPDECIWNFKNHNPLFHPQTLNSKTYAFYQVLVDF
jgi:predicted nucleotidyltransferase